eukprot:1037762-Alexandrium_andersonii.AAC.1
MTAPTAEGANASNSAARDTIPSVFPVSGGRYQQQMRSGPILQCAMSHTRSSLFDACMKVKSPVASSLANTRTPPPAVPLSRRATM